MCGLADLFHFTYQRVGAITESTSYSRHGPPLVRGRQLQTIARSERLVIAISHGSRSQLVATATLRFPSILIFDYEFASHMPGISARWVMMLEVMPS